VEARLNYQIDPVRFRVRVTNGVFDVRVARLPIADRHAHASLTTPGRATEEGFSDLERAIALH